MKQILLSTMQPPKMAVESIAGEKNVRKRSPDALQAPTVYRFSGHQTFALRIAWIPKAVRSLFEGRDPLTNIDEGITTLGLGKNMVEALRCWIESYGVATKLNGKWRLTPIGEVIFHPKGGLDPHIEDVSTPWILHWLIATNTRFPFFAWECLFNRWPATEFSSSQVLDAFNEESKKTGKPVSEITLRQHWEVFLHSYHPPRAAKSEDHLDSAMSVLRIITESGERPNAFGRWETLYSFDTGRKTSISQELFSFFVQSWWESRYPAEHTVPIREIVLGSHSPGRILKMQEKEIFQRLTELAKTYPDIFGIVESMSQRQLRIHCPKDPLSALRAAYSNPHFI